MIPKIGSVWVRVNVGRTRRLLSPTKSHLTHLHQNVLWPTKHLLPLFVWIWFGDLPSWKRIMTLPKIDALLVTTLPGVAGFSVVVEVSLWGLVFFAWAFTISQREKPLSSSFRNSRRFSTTSFKQNHPKLKPGFQFHCSCPCAWAWEEFHRTP